MDCDVKEWAANETPDTSHPSQSTQTALQQSIEGLYLSVKQRKQTLYRQNDSNKLRHRLRKKLGEEKRLLLQEVQKYNTLQPDPATHVDVDLVEHSLSEESTVSQIWPWEAHDSANIATKKQMHDQVMLTLRLQEERGVLVLEMAQHCTWLQNLAELLKNKVAEEGTENEGLCCLLKRRLSEWMRKKVALAVQTPVRMKRKIQLRMPGRFPRRLAGGSGFSRLPGVGHGWWEGIHEG
ncbi:hypothetical protein GJAV_G00162830 [Gymnothorax javanicus]|nr:hypothetical protein GJAV_G00162830 [Gymnothorax javanicus]